MKRLIVLVIVSVGFLLSSCGKEMPTIFYGESENWQLSYEVQSPTPSQEETQGTIQFIGTGEVPDTIDYVIDSGGDASSGVNISVTNKQAKVGRSSCTGCATTPKDSEFEAEISWNGKSEKMTLSSQ